MPLFAHPVLSLSAGPGARWCFFPPGSPGERPLAPVPSNGPSSSRKNNGSSEKHLRTAPSKSLPGAALPANIGTHMNRLRLFAALVAACAAFSSCCFLHTQKAGQACAPEEQTEENAAAPERQVPAPALTPEGAVAEGAEPDPVLPPAPPLPGEPPVPALSTAAEGAYVPSPAEFSSSADNEGAPVPPPPPPAAELRGLRSPKLPSNLPMSLDGKLIH